MRDHTRRWGRLGLIIAITSAVMCADPETTIQTDEAHHDEASNAQSETQIRYHLTWDWGEAAATEGGWAVVNDRGYTVEVTDGYLVTHSVQMAPCTDADLGVDTTLSRLFGAGRAWAGHGGVDDPSAWLTGMAESLAHPEPTALGPIAVNSGLYCRSHYLVARAEPGMLGLPESMDLVGVSLYIEGTAALDEPLPFAVLSTLPTGSLMGWTDPVSPIALTGGDIDVTITRDLGRLFDGVDFATMSDDAIQKTVLLGLAERVRVRVE
ncbi:MAG: hypothetical protein QF464_01995 [Myxococcota bacterium]|nr:hypothetical protein [Myxococcota bacterium]